jgi:ketosteroid isomerase-like protein
MSDEPTEPTEPTTAAAEEPPEHPNVRLVRRAYSALAEGDLDVARACLASDILWHFPNPVVGGDRSGVEDVLRYFAGVMFRSGGTLKVYLGTVEQDGDHHVVVRGLARAERDDKQLVNVFTERFLVRDNTIAEAWHSNDDQAHVDDFWA